MGLIDPSHSPNKMNKAQKIRDTIVAVKMLLFELEGLREIMEKEENEQN